MLSKPDASLPEAFGDVEELEFDYITMKLKPKLRGVEGSASRGQGWISYGRQGTVLFVLLSPRNSVKFLSEFRNILQTSSEILKF